VTLYVEAAAALEVPRLELAPSAVDWRVESDGVVHYLEAGTCINSASAWVYTTPSAISLVPGGAARIRVTVKVPRNAEPGVYRTGVRIAHNRDARTIGLSWGCPPPDGPYRSAGLASQMAGCSVIR
jgi:hypothetical protein